MKFLRYHITRKILVVVIWLGMAIYMLRPVQAEAASNSFSNWLNAVIKRGDTENIKLQLYQLRESEHSLNLLIRKASRIVSQHNEDFNLPLDKARPDTKDVYNLLIKEWNIFQTGNGMGKASIPKTIKSNFYPSVDKFIPALSAQSKKNNHSRHFFSGQTIPVDFLQLAYHIIPLSGGAAIGAP